MRIVNLVFPVGSRYYLNFVDAALFLFSTSFLRFVVFVYLKQVFDHKVKKEVNSDFLAPRQYALKIIRTGGTIFFNYLRERIIALCDFI